LIGKKLKKLNTISMQLTLAFSLLLIFMVGGIIVAVSILFSERFINQKIEVAQSSLESVADSIENRIDDIRKMMK